MMQASIPVHVPVVNVSVPLSTVHCLLFLLFHLLLMLLLPLPPLPPLLPLLPLPLPHLLLLLTRSLRAPARSRFCCCRCR